MDERQRDRLIETMREDLSGALGALDALVPLIREQGRSEDVTHMAMLSQALYRQLRTLLHMELTRRQDPTFLPRTADLAQLGRDLARQVEGLSQALNVNFSWEVEPDILLAVADPALLELALLNLLSGAISAAGRGGRVSLRLRSREGLAIFTVGNSGQAPVGWDGADSADSPQMARRVAALHGGALVLENRGEQGLQAVLSLPAAPRGQDRVEAPKMGFLLTGGFSPILIELSPLLPTECYELEELE